MQKNILITGAFGFIGRHVARYFFEQGWTVLGIGHGNWGKDEWRQWGIAKWHTSDITLNVLVTYANNPDVIAHCAGSGSVGYSINHPYQDYQRTVQTTLDVLEFTRLYAPEAKIVYPSSAGVYGIVGKMPISEDCILNPISPYGMHKKISEQLCLSYSKFFNLKIAIVRFFSVYGSGLRKQLMWDTCWKCSRRESEFFGTGHEQRDWIHISDAARLFYLASENANRSCPVVNGAVGQGVTVKQIVEKIFRTMSTNCLPEFSGKTKAGDPVDYVADVTKIHKWGFYPKKNWEDGIEEYVYWFQKEYA